MLCSGSLAARTNVFQQLKESLDDRLVGYRIGMKPLTYWSEVVSVVNEAREARTDLPLTLGADSSTDAVKVFAVVIKSISRLATGLNKLDMINPPTIPVVFIPTSL